MPRKSGMSGSVGGRRKRTWTQAPRRRPTQRHAPFCGSPGVQSPRATRLGDAVVVPGDDVVDVALDGGPAAAWCLTPLVAGGDVCFLRRGGPVVQAGFVDDRALVRDG